MKAETKLGIFTVLGLVLFGFSLYFLGGLSVTKTYDINNSTTIESYTCTVVHQIDHALWFEQPSSQWHTDLYKDLDEYLNQN